MNYEEGLNLLDEAYKLVNGRDSGVLLLLDIDHGVVRGLEIREVSMIRGHQNTVLERIQALCNKRQISFLKEELHSSVEPISWWGSCNGF